MGLKLMLKYCLATQKCIRKCFRDIILQNEVIYSNRAVGKSIQLTAYQFFLLHVFKVIYLWPHAAIHFSISVLSVELVGEDMN